MDRQVAVALQYKEDDTAPRVIARGLGPVAARIMELARQHGIPIRRQGDVAQALSHIDLGASVPPELFSVVAEILAFVYLVDSSLSPSPDRTDDSD